MNSLNEQVNYRLIPGFPAYRLGSDGSFWSRMVRTKRGIGNGRGSGCGIGKVFRQLSPKPNMAGYFLLRLSDGHGNIKHNHLHRLLAEVFHGPPPFSGAMARHWDGNPLNNSIDNIVWGSAKDNSDDSRRHGTLRIGEQTSAAKLTKREVVSIRQMIEDGIDNQTIAARFPVSPGAVSQIRRGVNWRHLGPMDARASNPHPPKIITFKGRSLRLASWAREVGINKITLNTRLLTGWSVEKALITPVNKAKRNRQAKCI